MVPGYLRSRRSIISSRISRPMTNRRVPSYSYAHNPRFDPVGYMEYQNFLLFQERMCVIFQLTLIMFCIFLLLLIVSMFLDTFQ